MILVRFLDLKFLHKRAAIIIGTSNPPHYQRFECLGRIESSLVTMRSIKAIAVFCGSNYGASDVFADGARALGRALGKAGITSLRRNDKGSDGRCR